MLLRDFLKEGISRLGSLYPPSEARDIMLTLAESRLGTGRYVYATDPDYSLNEESVNILSHDLARLETGEPLQYVLGYAEFFGRRFKVTPDVLIPRPETEILCDEALRLASGILSERKALGNSAPLRVLDLCTGSGCIAWTIALEIPGAQVYAVDISEKALAVASGQDIRQSSERSRRPVFHQADILQDPPHFPCETFDLILSNPPYIMESQKKDMRSNVLDYEPSIALFVPDEDPLLFYRAVARWAGSLMAPGGMGIVEINELLGPRIHDLFLDSGFEKARIIKDFAAKDRFVFFS